MNKAEIVVMAENGLSRTYTIYIYRGNSQDADFENPEEALNSDKKEENNKITITPTAQPTSTPKPIQANQKAGDVNGDGAVTVMDLLKVRKAILGMNQLTEEEQKAADINGNGKIDVLDLLRIQKSILGIE